MSTIPCGKKNWLNNMGHKPLTLRLKVLSSTDSCSIFWNKMFENDSLRSWEDNAFENFQMLTTMTTMTILRGISH